MPCFAPEAESEWLPLNSDNYVYSKGNNTDMGTDTKTDTDVLTPAQRGPKTILQNIWSKVWNNLLFTLTLVAVVLGLILGVIVQQTVTPYSTDLVVVLLKFPGELLLRMLKCVILPLVVASVITGLGAINAKSCGKIGGVAVTYYLTTTVMASILGLCLVSIIKPGSGNQEDFIAKDVTLNQNTNTLDTMMDLLRGAFPDNIVQATFGKHATELTNVTREDGSSYLNRSLEFKSGMNMIGVIVFSIVIGVIMSLHPKEAAPLMKVIQAVNDVTMRLVTLILWYSPIGIFFLIAGQFAGVENFGEMMAQLGMYMVTVLGGIAIHFFIVLPGIFYAFTRRNPVQYYLNMLPAIATAFGTDSSSATMPVTLKCVEENNNIDKRISRFVIPVGATINMDGTALYEAVACLFIAQVKGVPLNFGQVIVTGLTATLAAVGAAGIPSAGLVTMVMVLNAVNLPTDMISVLLTVDWFLDRFRTITNVMGDALGCAIVQHLCAEELAEMDREKELQEEGGAENLIHSRKGDIEMGSSL
ncbi:excitatory amino acid transporter-like isoform X2 [Bolinopsis microptera]|uniref:excitatory amino acid transporter-like isoform X2 n=1 Tax=Bolinopsis microptera TaxID=2820187 RepID=UPI00307939B3